MARRYRRHRPGPFSYARPRRRYSRPRWRGFRRHKKAPLPILPLLGGVVSPMIQAFETAGGVNALQANPGNFGMDMLDQIGQRYTGISFFPQRSGSTGFNTTYLFNTYGGLIAGIFGHMLASKFGVNRAMKKIPYVGKWISL